MRIGITGHRGLTGDLAREVQRRIVQAIDAHDPVDLVGVSCIADGPDAWFARSVLDRGGHLEVVIPAEAYRASLPEWHHGEYDALFEAATTVHATGLAESNEQAHMRGSEILVDIVDHLLAVWDGQPARGYGGTADVVAYAHEKGVSVHVVWPEGAVRD